MKFLRYGAAGQEKPGLLDADGTIRDLSAHVSDLSGAALDPDALAKLGALDVNSLPKVEGNPRIGPCVRARASSSASGSIIPITLRKRVRRCRQNRSSS